MNTPQRNRTAIALAVAIVILSIISIAAAAYMLLIATASPAHGQIIVITPLPRSTATMPARAWLMAQNNYAAPVASSCEAPGPCEGESR